LHQHGIWTGFSRATWIWRNRNNGPTVIAAHGALDPLPLRRSNWKKQIALAAYERKNLRRASCLHALSMRERDNYRDFGLRNPVAVIPNGISEEWIDAAADPEGFKDRFGISRDSKMMLFLSRITPIKGLPMLVEAAASLHAELRGWTVVIAGMDELDHEREVRSLVDRMDLADRFLFTGPLFGQDKRDAYAAADLFVLPSHSEAAPVAVLEALGAGVPVLTTTASPWEEIQSSGCGWRVDPSADAISTALEDALRRTPEVLAKQGAAGRNLVRERYTWQGIAPRTLELYDWLLGKQSRPQFVYEA
jgi:glycosyltransferase involved in cell wall biosynthesis